MKLFARKPCSFNGKNYFIGNEIPLECVLDPKAQEKLGILVVVEGESSNAAPAAGGPLLPPASTSENVACKATECVNEEANVSCEATYSKNTLVRMNKEELLKIAVKRGVDADAEMRKEEIADLIIKKQGE